jgi:hypothetical protein
MAGQKFSGRMFLANLPVNQHPIIRETLAKSVTQYENGTIQIILEISLQLKDLIIAADRKTKVKIKKLAALHAFVTYMGNEVLAIMYPASTDWQLEQKNKDAIFADG